MDATTTPTRPLILTAMFLAEEAGMCRAWLNMDARCGAALAAAPGEAVREEYLALRDRMAAMVGAEAENGSGSQLRLDHPLVARMLANERVRFFTEGQVEAARRREAA